MYILSKRLCDIFLSVLAIVFFLLPWLIIAAVIKIQSPGPVIYKSRRVGLNGEVFTLYKFRSMSINSGKVRSTTLRSDARIFPFGKFLRISKLDETLQLINILKGDMSVIGPRPEDESNAKEIYVGKYKHILSMKPGLSSPASLYDYTHGEKFESEEQYLRYFLPQKLELELYYVNNASLAYDAKLVLKTIITILLTLFGKENFSEPREMKKCKMHYIEEKQRIGEFSEHE